MKPKKYHHLIDLEETNLIALGFDPYMTMKAVKIFGVVKCLYFKVVIFVCVFVLVFG